jgi:hypothetical protein
VLQLTNELACAVETTQGAAEKILCCRARFHSQRLRGVLNRGIKIASLSVRYSESVDHVLVLPYHNAARGLCVFHCLLPIAKRRVRARRPKPGTIAQRPGERHIPGMKRDEMIKFLYCFGVFPKASIDVGAQQRSLHNTPILPECFVTILQRQVVFAFP